MTTHTAMRNEFGTLMIGTNEVASVTSDDVIAFARANAPTRTRAKLPKNHGYVDARTANQRDRLRARLEQRRLARQNQQTKQPAYR
jgi:hypothetical protein